MQQLPEMPAEPEFVIETDRLELRPIGQDDAEVMFHVLSDPSLYEYTGEAPPESPDVLRRVYASREARRSPDASELWFNWVVRERSPSHTPVGYVQASVAATHAEVAWVIGAMWQNRGYASEASSAVIQWLRTLGVTRIRAKIHPRHAASQRVASHAGLKRTDECSGGEDVWLLEAD